MHLCGLKYDNIAVFRHAPWYSLKYHVYTIVYEPLVSFCTLTSEHLNSNYIKLNACNSTEIFRSKYHVQKNSYVTELKSTG